MAFDSISIVTEETAVECADGDDNDGDGSADCDDDACSAFIFCAVIDASIIPDAGRPDARRDAALAIDAGLDARDIAALDTGSFPDAQADAGFDSSFVDGGRDSGFASDVGVADARVPHLRPPGIPDVLVVAVSGHCNPATCGTYPNIEYLGRDGIPAAIARSLLERGGVVEQFLVTDNFYDVPAAAALPGTPAARGFLSLLNALRTARDVYVSDWDNPTRIIVVAHSHGTVWSHLALHVLESEGAPIPVDLLVDLDAVSNGWQAKAAFGFGDAWGAVIQDYTIRTGVSWPFAPWNVVDAFTVAGVVGAQDIEDITPFSALNNLEVWAATSGLVPGAPDRDVNHRVDGSTEGVLLFRSVQSHNGTAEPGSDSITTTADVVRALYGL
jgi:hypothetical protein